jgi:hypothetical protein
VCDEGSMKGGLRDEGEGLREGAGVVTSRLLSASSERGCSTATRVTPCKPCRPNRPSVRA